MEDIEILVSIVIPVKNGEFWLVKLFEKLKQQTLIHQTEIIVIDSGSTDRSLEIIRQYPVNLIQIQPSEFNHGETRNVGVRAAKGKYVVMTVQDAVPVNDLWLENLLDGFIDDNVAGVCGQQIVAHEKENNPVEWFYPVNKPSITSYHFENSKDFKNLTPEEKKHICGWDDVTACYRRDMLLKIPFRKIDFAEDLQWAYDALMSGYTIVYNTFARVYHHHQMTNEFSFKSSLTVLYYRYKILGYKPKPVQMTLKQHLQMIYILLKRDISLQAKCKWWKNNINHYLQTKRAFRVFSSALKAGEINLDKSYSHICSTPPQAKNITRNEQ